MSNLSEKERQELPEDDFAGPNRTFPIVDASDVIDAARLLARAKNPAAVKRRIIAIARRKGFRLPDVWREAGDARMSASGELGAPRSGDDLMVTRSGKIFEAGEYADKGFSLSPEELFVATDRFEPVPINLEHENTVLDGKLGWVTRVWNDGRNLYAQAEIPKWLDDALGDAPRRVSCEWDRNEKTLERVALVLNPRLTDAALMAAFTRSMRAIRPVTEAGEQAREEEKKHVGSFKETLKRWVGLGMPEDFDPAPARENDETSGTDGTNVTDGKSEFIRSPEYVHMTARLQSQAAQIKALTQELEAQAQARFTADNEAAIAAFVREGKLLPAGAESAAQARAADPAKFDAFIAGAPRVVALTEGVVDGGDVRRASEGRSDAVARFNQLVEDRAEKKKIPLHEAAMQIGAEQPALAIDVRNAEVEAAARNAGLVAREA